MTYTDSLWKDAPVGATHCGVHGCYFVTGQKLLFLKETRKGWFVIRGNGKWFQGNHPGEQFTELHAKPACYTSAAQLVDQYRKEHGAIEEGAATFLDGCVFSGEPLSLDHLLDDAAFHLALLEKYLAAERARVEGEGK